MLSHFTNDSHSQNDDNVLTIRALITSNEAGLIIGKGGHTIDRLRTMGVKVGVSHNVEGIIDRVLTFTNDSHSQNDDNVLTIRALITSNEAGLIIGKGGHTIDRLRTMGVKVGVSHNVEGIIDRVLTVIGTIQNIVNAFSCIIEILTETINAFNLRLLISHQIMGTVIGKNGVRIHHIQDVSDVYIKVHKKPLPYSTERIVDIHGTIHAILKALTEIAMCLLKDKDKVDATIYYIPSKTPPFTLTTPRYSFDNDEIVSDTSVQQVSIPNELIGRIIGKGGHRISEIRRVTGCSIKVDDEHLRHELSDRIITIQGPSTSTKLAASLLYSQLERNKMYMEPLVERDLIDLTD